MLKPKIKEIFDLSEQRFGANKIVTKLKDYGITSSDKKIGALMREMGLVPILVSKRIKYPKSDPTIALQNTLGRNFELSKAKWVC